MIYKINESFVLRNIGTVWVVVDIHTNKLYELNDTAAEIFRLLQKSISKKEIVDVLSRMYDQEKSIICHDLESLIDSFMQIGILSSLTDNEEKKNGSRAVISARHFDYYVRNIWKNIKHPYKVKSFELTPRCNFWCYHCYQGELKRFGKAMTTKEIKQIIDKMLEIGVLEIVLTGGEPLIRQDFKDIYAYAKQRGLLVRLFTNGTLIDDSLISLFKEYPPEKLIVSIYGMSEETYKKTTHRNGMFDVVMRNLDKISQSYIPFSIKFIVSKITLSDFDSVCRYAIEKKAELRYAFYIYPSNDNDQSVCDYMIDVKDMLYFDIQYQSAFNKNVAKKKNNWFAFYRKNGFVPQFLCDFPHNQFYIDFTGQVFACSAGMKSIGGNIIIDDFNEIWKRFLDVRKIPMKSLNECVSCDALYYCVNCPSDEYSFYGDAELINKKVCLFAKAKKLYYSDHYSYEEIVQKLRL